MSRKLATILAVLALCLSAVPGALAALPSQFTAGSSGLGDPYFPLDGNGGYDVQHYDLALTYDPATDQLTGVATITARATQNLSAFNLDFIGLRLRSLTVNGVSATTTRKGQELTVKLKTGLTNGSTFTVVARYDGVPQPLIESIGRLGFLPTEDGAIVQGEPHVAATWFPANDHPRDKASFTFHITIPSALEAIANGVLSSHQTNGAWGTWNWDAVEPMVPYLAMMVIDDLEIRDYVADGISYWDAIDTDMLTELRPPILPVAGAQFLWSQASEPAYKRVTRTIAVPAGGAQVSFQVNRDTEPDFDYLFVEARTAGGNDWTTLPDLNGHTSQAFGACPFITDVNPFLLHYLTPVLVDAGDPTTPDDDEYSCDPTGTSGTWNAISGTGDGWETWTVQLADAGGLARQVELSIAYASDFGVQGQGVVLDQIVVSTGVGSTGFEADGNTLDGWTTPPAPDPNQPNQNTWIATTFVPAVPGRGTNALVSFDKQPEIIAFESDVFGPYPFSSAGGIVHDGAVRFALENQTRPVYSPTFFRFSDGNDFVVVHELAHQWFGDSVAVDTWRETWLNEGFATYAEWLWGDHEGFFTPQNVFDDLSTIPADEGFWDFAIGDPGVDGLFEGQVYDRGGMTLHALRLEVGDNKFFRILKAWATTQAGGTGSTREFIDLAESIYRKDLDPLFAEWLSAGKPASLESAAVSPASAAAGRAALERLGLATQQHASDKAAAKEMLARSR
jgi:hypothetical protein